MEHWLTGTRCFPESDRARRTEERFLHGGKMRRIRKDFEEMRGTVFLHEAGDEADVARSGFEELFHSVSEFLPGRVVDIAFHADDPLRRPGGGAQDHGAQQIRTPERALARAEPRFFDDEFRRQFPKVEIYHLQLCVM